MFVEHHINGRPQAIDIDYVVTKACQKLSADLLQNLSSSCQLLLFIPQKVHKVQHSRDSLWFLCFSQGYLVQRCVHDMAQVKVKCYIRATCIPI